MTQSIAIRPAHPHEAEAIRAVVRAAYARWMPVIGREPLPMAADYERALREHRIDVAVEAQRIVGPVETIPRADHLWIQNVAVEPRLQGRGVGSRLFAHAEDAARGLGLAELRLLTNGAFAANIALYRRLGYGIDREEPFMGGTTVYMSKRLAAGGGGETAPV
jgi:GNAT superfamily N-acetyltransferase